MPQNDWLSYPKNKPDEEQQYQDFAVLYQNPHRIRKIGCNLNIPHFQPAIMTWTGKDWLDAEFPPKEVAYFHPLPPQPKE